MQTFIFVQFLVALKDRFAEKFTKVRSSHPELFCKKVVFRNFAKFSKVSFLIKLQAQPQACNFITKETLAQVFSCEFCEISRNNFSYKTPPVATSQKFMLEWILLSDQAKLLLSE